MGEMAFKVDQKTSLIRWTGVMGIIREYHSLNQAEAQIRWCGCNLLVRASTFSSDEVRAVPFAIPASPNR